MIRIPIIVSIFIALFITWTSCDRQGENIPTQAPTANQYVEDGWLYYENGDYVSALEAFTLSKSRDAVKEDAYNGLGWTYSKLHDYEASISNFMLLLSITESNTIKANIYAGLTMTYGAMQMAAETEEGRSEVSGSIFNYADSLIHYDSDFEFEHDTHVNVNTIRAILAQSYFNTQEFVEALDLIEQYLESGFTQRLIDGQIIQQRVDTIGVSVGPQTSMTGEASLRIQYMDDGAEERDAQIVDITSINHYETDVEYQVVDFNQGGNLVTISGNPVPHEEDQFVAMYNNAEDYGYFLIELLDVIQNNL